MALTELKGNNTISVLFDAATLWDSQTAYPDGLLIESMEFKPTATDDLIIVREKIATGVQYFSEKSATAYDNKIKYFNTEKSRKRLFPYVKADERTTGTLLIIVLK